MLRLMLICLLWWFSCDLDCCCCTCGAAARTNRVVAAAGSHQSATDRHCVAAAILAVWPMHCVNLCRCFAICKSSLNSVPSIWCAVFPICRALPPARHVMLRLLLRSGPSATSVHLPRCSLFACRQPRGFPFGDFDLEDVMLPEVGEFYFRFDWELNHQRH